MSYYFHHQFSSAYDYTGFKPFRMPSPNQGQFVCVGRGNSLEIHRIVSNGLAFHARYQFHCNIVRIQVIESLCHNSDFIWILDSLGRYGCWRPGSGYQTVFNQICEEALIGDSQETECQRQNSLIFSGVNYEFEQCQTVGTIFYTIKNKIIVMAFNINKQGFFIDESRVMKYELPLSILRHVNWVKNYNKSFMIGCVQQIDGKTALRVYNLELGLGLCSQALDWQLQKINILSFCSDVAGQILLLTYNQICLHYYKSGSSVCNYRTRGNYSQGLYIGQGFYAHLGEQLTIFSKDKLRTYGSLKFQKDLMKDGGLIESSFLGQIEEGVKLVAVVTLDRDAYLLAITQKTVQIFTKMSNLTNTLSFCPLNSKDNCLVSVNRDGNSKFAINLIQRKQCLSILTQQHFPYVIHNIISVLGGSYVVFACLQGNYVFRFNRNQCYTYYFKLPFGFILSMANRYAVFESGIYEIDYQSQSCVPIKECHILLASVIEEVVYYLDQKGCLHRYEDNSEVEDVIVCTDRAGDYCWGTICRNYTLICASLSHHSQLKMFNFQGKRQISIKGHALVSCICVVAVLTGKQLLRLSDNARQHILVGYVDGSIHMHSQNSHLLHTFDHFGASPVTFLKISETSILVVSGSKHYYLNYSKDVHQLKEVRLSNAQHYIPVITYISKTDQLIFIQHQQYSTNRHIRLIDLKQKSSQSQLHKNTNQSLTITKITEIVNSSPPLILITQGKLIVASAHCLQLFNFKVKKPLKVHILQLKQLVGLQLINIGILICGLDAEDRQIVICLDQDFQQLCRFVLNTKKHLKSIKAIPDTNQFLLRYHTFVTLYKITPNFQLLQLMGSNLNMQGSHIDLHSEAKTMLINDPNRHLSLFQYQNAINCLGKYVPAYTINAATFIEQDIAVVDQRGTLFIIEVKQNQQIGRLVFNKIASFNLAEEDIVFGKKNNILYYVTPRGNIGTVEAISKEQFDVFKKIQDNITKLIHLGNRFSHEQWRNRYSSTEKMIDANFIQLHLLEHRQGVLNNIDNIRLASVLSLFC